MKKHLFFISFLIIILVLVAGCTNESQPQPQQGVRTDKDLNRGDTIAKKVVILPSPTTSAVEITQPIPIITTVIPTPLSPQAQITMVSVDTLCGELVFCGELPASSGVIAVPSTRCAQINTQVVRRDKDIIRCFKDAYQGTGVNNMPLWNIEYIKLLCKKGIGSPGRCERYGAILMPKDRS